MSSEIKANSIQDKTGTRVLASDSGSAWSWGSGIPAGTIIQVVGKTLKNSNYSDTATFSDWVAITGFEVDISPKQTNSDFLVSLTTSVSGTGSAEGHILLRRGYDSSGGTTFTETDINGDTNGARTRSTYVHAYDFGSTSDIHSSNLDTVTSNIWDNDISYVAGSKFRYKVYWRNTLNTTGDLYLNHTSYNAVETATGISSIIIQEIAGT
tara:strand:- start:103 stop:732 length:630 start_codon:yes stop_codon:yes gene_type:complete